MLTGSSSFGSQVKKNATSSDTASVNSYSELLMMSRVKRTVAARLLELSVMIIVGAAAAVGRKTGSKTDDRRFAAVVTSATFVLPFIGE